MEAITVIDLPLWFLEKLHEGRSMRVAVQKPQLTPFTDPPRERDFSHVTIWAEKFIRKGQQAWLLFTGDEELAMLLRSDVLPGQRKEFQMEFKRGFVHGLLASVGR
jgi:hypothetical protein